MSRHLAWSSCRLEDLKLIERRFGTTINDIFLAAAAGAVRDLLLERGESPGRLKAMVPVSVRAPQERWGNRIAFVFPGLPCEEPDPGRRLCEVHDAMCAHKLAHAAEAADSVITTVGAAPRLLRDLGSRLLTSARLSNLTISNVPGPPVPLYLRGCRIRRAYPVVPLAAGHGISVGMTSFDGWACFGVYADSRRAAYADRLARGLRKAVDELLAGKTPSPCVANGPWSNSRSSPPRSGSSSGCGSSGSPSACGRSGRRGRRHRGGPSLLRR